MNTETKDSRIAAIKRQIESIDFQLECAEQSDSSFYSSGRRGRLLDWKKQLLSDIYDLEAEGNES